MRVLALCLAAAALVRALRPPPGLLPRRPPLRLPPAHVPAAAYGVLLPAAACAAPSAALALAAHDDAAAAVALPPGVPVEAQLAAALFGLVTWAAVTSPPSPYEAQMQGGGQAGPVGEAAIAALRAYKRVLSPLMQPACRFTPTCSVYAVEAIRTFGPAQGAVLTSWRVLRCSPLHVGRGGTGYDPPVWPPCGWDAGASAGQPEGDGDDGDGEGDGG